jgi:hypothetical protein
MAAGFYGNDYLPLKFVSVSFYCQVSDTGSAHWASRFNCFSLQIRPPRYNWNIVESGVKHHNLALFKYVHDYLVPVVLCNIFYSNTFSILNYLLNKKKRCNGKCKFNSGL